LRVEAGCVLRKLDFEVQRVEGFRRTRSLSDGGRFGLGAGVSHAFSKRLSPSPQTTHGRNDIARGVCVSREFRLTKGAYTKRERVYQLSDKATPALVRRAGVKMNLRETCLRRLSPLIIQHGIFSRVSEKVRVLAGELVN
jgi:hypothetical protein